MKEVLIDGSRYVVCLNEEQKRKDEKDRKAIVSALKDQLKAAGAKALVGNKGYRKYLKTVGEVAFEVDDLKIESEDKYGFGNGGDCPDLQASLDCGRHVQDDEIAADSPSDLSQEGRDNIRARVL